MTSSFGPAGLAVRMLVRSPVKLYAVSLLLLVMAFLLTGATLLGGGVKEAALRGAQRLGADLMVVPEDYEMLLPMVLIGGAPVILSLPAGIEEKIASLPGVSRIAPQYFLSSARDSCCEAGNLLLVGFDPEKDFTVTPWQKGGERFVLHDREAVVGGGVQKARGALLRLYNTDVRVAHRLEKSGFGYFDNAVFIPFRTVESLEVSSRTPGFTPLVVPWSRPSLLLVKLSAGADPRLTAELVEKNCSGTRVVTMPELFREQRGRLEGLAGLTAPVTAAAWLLAMTAGGAVLSLYVNERRAVLGLLQSCGYGRWSIGMIFGFIILMQSFAAMVAGSVAAYAVIRGFSAGFAGVLGLPLLIGPGALSAADLPRLWLLFAGGMTFEVLLILWYHLRREPADLLRGC